VSDLFKSIADHTEPQIIHRFLSYDCLFIDELDYVEVEPVQVGLFFTLMHKRHRNKPTLITSNLGFSEWRSFLKNDRLTAALIHRLTENSHVINMKNWAIRPKCEIFLVYIVPALGKITRRAGINGQTGAKRDAGSLNRMQLSELVNADSK
jgi:hypothetical protein